MPLPNICLAITSDLLDPPATQSALILGFKKANPGSLSVFH